MEGRILALFGRFPVGRIGFYCSNRSFLLPNVSAAVFVGFMWANVWNVGFIWGYVGVYAGFMWVSFALCGIRVGFMWGFVGYMRANVGFT